jgi:hypothetical protein
VLVAARLVIVAAPTRGAGSLTSEVDGLRLELTSRPGRPVTSGLTEYVVRLTRQTGQPVEGARLTLRGAMTDGMSVVVPLGPAREAGVYRGRVLFTMEGRWALVLRIALEGARFELPLTEHVGR